MTQNKFKNIPLMELLHSYNFHCMLRSSFLECNVKSSLMQEPCSSTSTYWCFQRRRLPPPPTIELTQKNNYILFLFLILSARKVLGIINFRYWYPKKDLITGRKSYLKKIKFTISKLGGQNKSNKLKSQS